MCAGYEHPTDRAADVGVACKSFNQPFAEHTETAVAAYREIMFDARQQMPDRGGRKPESHLVTIGEKTP